MKSSNTKTRLVLSALLVMPGVAWANAGVPMLFLTLPVLLVPFFIASWWSEYFVAKPCSNSPQRNG